MRSLEKLPIDHELYQKLKTEGWVNEGFLSNISIDEIKSIFNIKDPTITSEEIENFQKKIRQKTYQIIDQLTPPNSSQWAISTGSTQLDAFLDGNGIQSGTITLLYGKARSGKSQIASQCCVNVYRQFQSHLPQKVILYLDTEGAFRPERINQMAKALDLSSSDILRRLIYVHVQSYNEFNLIQNKIEQIIEENGVKLLIIDSITQHYRLELAKSDQSPYKIIQSFIQLGKSLIDLAKSKNIAVIITSQVTASISKSYFFDVIPVLSHALNFFCKQWILLADIEENLSATENIGRRYAHLVNGLMKAENIAQFQICDAGIRDFIPGQKKL